MNLIISFARFVHQQFIAHLIHVEVKHFPDSAYDEALRWIRAAAIPAHA